jgi:glycosyltransferase involved in cell wall biosynthesis
MKTGNECIDIVTPVLNSEKTIIEFLDAIEKEIPVNNIIFVDGGSIDNTIDLIRGHNLWKQNHVKIWIEPNLNIGQARFLAMQQVVTDYWAWIDSDVIIQSGWYEAMMNKIKEDDIMAVETNKIEFYRVVAPPEHHRRLFGGNLFRRQVIELFKENDWDIFSNEDEFMQLVIERNGYKIGKIDEPLVHHKSPFNRHGGTNIFIIRMNDNKWVGISEGIFKRRNHLSLFNYTVFSFYLPIRLWSYMMGKSFWRYMGYLFPKYYDIKLRTRMVKTNYNWVGDKSVR